MTNDPAEQAILSLLRKNPGKSIAPSDAARALAGNPAGEAWRGSLSPIKLAAQRLAKRGEIVFLRKGQAVTPLEARGVVRLRLAEKGDAA
jgi:hypothetical protein